ncbi:retinoid-inducible serine carboxypeptidase-like [Oppia nitens]|uniref:retinoid-inducible serine carboxypeptidase-like n=1 Tax=Oppia nitens TaxID=1686743 RepID=UPI0023DAE314|nr:retinoid-inducible serine carboxypeptidase-like [Oppia nitens]
MEFKLVLFLFYTIYLLNGKINAYKESSGYVTVRPDAHMFWWLFQTDSNNNITSNLPLVIWLQGGPGGSSTGFGNFGEIGPQDVNLNNRSTSWIKYANLLFIDNPVGTGYSYVTNNDSLTKNNKEIAVDLVTLMKEFYKKFTNFESTPLYIFSESYGGKMTVGFAKELHQAIKNNEIKSNFKGVALGDSWISPLDSTSSWGDYLYSLSYIDSNQKNQIDSYSKRIKDALKSGDGERATNLWATTEGLVGSLTGGIDWYNVLLDTQTVSRPAVTAAKVKLYNSLANVKNSALKSAIVRQLSVYSNDDLDRLMNSEIKKKLNIPSTVTWGGQSGQVFSALSGDFMLPVVDDVDYLLNNTDLKVVVYTGQLDLIVDTIGTLNWMSTLKWSGFREFDTSPRHQFGGIHSGFYKTYKNLSLYWIIKAGHMVPSDAGHTALQMLQKVIHN